jgi:uncharacterized protein
MVIGGVSLASAHQLLQQTAHRPWAVPCKPWLWSQWWLDVLFLHWQVPAAALRPCLPEGLEIDTWEQAAWVSVVPFHMARIRPRWLPPVRAISDFPELNVRTYVHRDGKPGIYFLSIHAGNRAAVQMARWFSPLPYVYAPMECQRTSGRFRFQSFWPLPEKKEPAFSAEYSPSPRQFRAPPGSLEEWLLERYRLYVGDSRGRLLYAEVHHEPWSIQNLDFTMTANSMGQSLGLDLSRAPDRVHFSTGVQTIAWPFTSVDSTEPSMAKSR